MRCLGQQGLECPTHRSRSVYIINSKRQRYSRPEFYSLSPHLNMEPAANRRTLLATAPKVPYVGVADEVKPKFKTLTTTSHPEITPSVATDG